MRVWQPTPSNWHESSNFFFSLTSHLLAGTGVHGCREWGKLNVSGANLWMSGKIHTTRHPRSQPQENAEGASRRKKKRRHKGKKKKKKGSQSRSRPRNLLP